MGRLPEAAGRKERIRARLSFEPFQTFCARCIDGTRQKGLAMKEWLILQELGHNIASIKRRIEPQNKLDHANPIWTPSIWNTAQLLCRCADNTF